MIFLPYVLSIIQSDTMQSTKKKLSDAPFSRDFLCVLCLFVSHIFLLLFVYILKQYIRNVRLCLDTLMADCFQ